jgi:hypothetical protein
MRYYTTLHRLRKYNLSSNKYIKLVSAIGNTWRKIGLDEILEHLGPISALESLYTVTRTEDFLCDWYNFKADVAEHVLPLFEKIYPNDQRPRTAIAAARKIAKNLITKKEATEIAWKTAESSWTPEELSRQALDIFEDIEVPATTGPNIIAAEVRAAVNEMRSVCHEHERQGAASAAAHSAGLSALPVWTSALSTATSAIRAQWCAYGISRKGEQEEIDYQIKLFKKYFCED